MNEYDDSWLLSALFEEEYKHIFLCPKHYLAHPCEECANEMHAEEGGYTCEDSDVQLDTDEPEVDAIIAAEVNDDGSPLNPQFTQDYLDANKRAQALDDAGDIMPTEEQASEEPSKPTGRKTFKFSF